MKDLNKTWCSKAYLSAVSGLGTLAKGKNMADKRNVFLDQIRALACIGVMLFHYTQRFEELYGLTPDWKFKLTYGRMIISVFFILSGYLAVVKDEGGTTVLGYLKKKAFRLYPAYWVCIILTFAGTSLFLKDRAVSVSDLFVNFTMLQSFVGAALVDGAHWTLANELVFYVFILLCVVVLKKHNGLPVFFLLWMIILFLFYFFKADTPLFKTLGTLIADQYAQMFIVGSSIFFLKKGSNANRILSLLNIILAVVYQFMCFGKRYTLFFVFASAVIAVCVLADKILLKAAEKAEFVFKPLSFAAAISYPLYLLHQNWGYIILKALINKGFHSEWIILVPIIAVGAVSCAIHFLVEKPLIKYGKGNLLYSEK